MAECATYKQIGAKLLRLPYQGAPDDSHVTIKPAQIGRDAMLRENPTGIEPGYGKVAIAILVSPVQNPDLFGVQQEWHRRVNDASPQNPS